MTTADGITNMVDFYFV